MKSVVVGVDGSECSLKALSVAVEIAAATKSVVVLAHVLPMPSEVPSDAHIPQAWLAEVTAAGDAMLRAAAELCAKAGVPSESRTLGGPPEEALARLGDQVEAEMIAVGSRGRGAVSRLLIGSVADRLVQTASRPVLVARC